MSQINRRKLISGTVGTMSLASLGGFSKVNAQSKTSSGLISDPNKIIDLPKGFRYTILERSGTKMDDGFLAPGRPDGMGCFKVGNDLVLMKNHEMSPSHDAPRPYATPKDAPKEAFDAQAFGGVSRIILDEKTLQIKRRNLVLTGTHLNCAGGISPWGWLSCEETISKGHGYVFLCDPLANTVQDAKAIKAYGRFNHEAACVDPATNTAYLTEDRGDSCLYRFVPEKKDQPFIGKFQCLAVKGLAKFNLGTEAIKIGAQFDVEWLDLSHQDSVDDSLRYQAQKLGAAIFSRGEGIWYSKDGIYFTATSGGPAQSGQIFGLSLDGKKLTLVTQSLSKDELDMPDNITVAPWGDIVVAEDGEMVPHIRIIDKNGKITTLARNAAGMGEFAGVCFSPDGKYLFANMQVQGLTIAIEGFNNLKISKK